MELSECLGFHSGIIYIHFLLLYESALWVIGYRRFERKNGSHFQKVIMDNSILPVGHITIFFVDKFGKHLHGDDGV